MIYLIWLISSIAIFMLGFHIKNISLRIETLEEMVREKADKKPRTKEVESELIDPIDPVKEALYERDKMMKELNPDA